MILTKLLKSGRAAKKKVFFVNDAVLQNRLAQIAPIGWGIVLNLLPVQLLHNTFSIVCKRLRHVVVENDIRRLAGCEQLLISRNFVGTSDRRELDLDIVFVAEFLLNPACIVVVGDVPAFERTLIYWNFECNSFRETLRVIGIAAFGVLAWRSPSFVGEGSFSPFVLLPVQPAIRLAMKIKAMNKDMIFVFGLLIVYPLNILIISMQKNLETLFLDSPKHDSLNKILLNERIDTNDR